MKIKYSRIHISGNANNKTKLAKEAWHEFYVFHIFDNFVSYNWCIYLIFKNVSGILSGEILNSISGWVF